MLSLTSLTVAKMPTAKILEDKMTTFEKLLEICSAVFEGEIDISTIKPEANLRDDVNINSIGLLYMAMAAEEEFGIKFKNEDFTAIRTVGDVIAFIESK